MQAYIAISFNKRKELQPELDAIKAIVSANEIIPFVFVDTYSYSPVQEKQMMQQAFAEIDKCSLLIAEVSEKAIGIGVELGYAKAKGKPVIYLRNREAEHSTTAAGASDYCILYSNPEDLKKQLNEILQVLVPLLT